MPKLNNFFDKTETVEKILTKKMHPQLVSIKNLENQSCSTGIYHRKM